MTGIQRALALSCWVNPTDARPLEGGITNENIKITDRGRDYVVRLGGDIPAHGILRWSELAFSRAAHAAGVAPAVHHHEPGVLVIDYIDGAALSAADLHDPATLMAATDLVRQLHQDAPRHLRGPALSFWVFHILRDYAASLRDRGSRHAPRLAALLDHAALLERATGPVTLVMGHNDLLPANILRGQGRLWLIDWEYAGLNTPLFDLGGLAGNAGLGAEAEAAMLARYFGAAPGPDRMRSYAALKCASLLRETMWSMMSEITSTLDFDYALYTEQYHDQFAAALAAFTQEHT